MSTIKFDLEVDYSEVDLIINRLMRAMRPEVIHNLAARLAKKQVKEKYSLRFTTQVTNYGQGYWQTFKEDVLPSSSPGFLTGTTYNSIRHKSTGAEGSVYLEGTWPKGAEIYTTGLGCIKWGDKGLEFKGFFIKDPQTGYRSPGPHYKDSEPLSFKKYGKEAGKEIKWMYLDDEDVHVINNGIEKLLDLSMKGDQAGLAALFESARKIKKQAAQAATPAEQPVEEEAPRPPNYLYDPADPRIPKLLEEEGVASIEVLFEKYAARTVNEVIQAINLGEMIGDTQKSEYEWKKDED